MMVFKIYLICVQTNLKTFNNFLDSDGCPDSSDSTLDSDMDGIIDTFDECPLEPETFNMFFDFDGCPDSIDCN